MPPRILIVEDEALVAMEIAAVLRERGVRLSVAEVEGMTYDVDDMERVADTALGRAEVATDSPTTSTP